MFRKPIFSLGAVALAATALFLAAPRAAHAIAATLVQVTNTAANPAITQGTEKQAAQIAELNCTWSPGDAEDACQMEDLSGASSPYTANPQNYVITGVDLLPLNAAQTAACGSASSVFNVTLYNNYMSAIPRYQWNISGPYGSHFTYPTGIVLTQAATPSIRGSGACVINVSLHGYYTAQ
jgi:hypothetical protein